MTTLPHLKLKTDGLWNKTGKGPNRSLIDAEKMAAAAARLREKFTSQSVGFYDWPTKREVEDLNTRAHTCAAEIRKNFEGVLIIGIGGSYLGPAAICQALRTEADDAEFSVYWLSNSDAPEIARVQRAAAKKKLATVVTSKSGNTVETLSAFFHLSNQLDPSGYVVITDPTQGELRRLATEYGWKSFEVPPNIGGRFSVLSSVGLLPAWLGGLDGKALIRGAQEMRAALENFVPHENPAYLLSLALHAWDQAYVHPIQYLMPYQMNLKLLGEWYVQLWGESLGKKQIAPPHRAVGPTAVAALGTTDQHSLLQLMKEGPSDKVVGFMEVEERATSGLKVAPPKFQSKEFSYLLSHTFEAINHQASLATEQSLANAGVPTYRIALSQLDEAALGAFFFFYETACAFAGELYGVNAFDQPGVEETKKLLRKAL